MITQRKKLAVCFGLSLGLVLIPAQTIFADETAEQISVVSVATQMVQSANSLTDSGNTKLAFTNKIMVNVEEYLNIRTEPDENASITGKLYKGSAADIVEQLDGWTKIQSGSVEGYVKNDYILFGDDAYALAKEICPLTATANESGLRVRTEPSTEAGVLEVIAEGASFQILEEGEEWTKVQYSSDTVGYLSTQYITVGLDIQEAISIEEEKAALEAAKKSEETAKADSSGSKTIETTSVAAVSASYDEAYLLAALVHMESGNECYEGKLAVANVVMNRLRSGSYGSSITGVIYAKGQFPGASNGLLDRILANGPNSESVAAANAALAGTNNIGSLVNFINVKYANPSVYSEYVIIGNHCFYRK
jgi:uncharacterized protein YgiM (DUF1202 family)